MQAVTLVGDLQEVRVIVVKDVVSLYRHFQDLLNQPGVYRDELRPRLDERLGLHHAPKIWGYLKDASIGKALQIDEESIHKYV
jgi:hypothetical protein